VHITFSAYEGRHCYTDTELDLNSMYEYKYLCMSPPHNMSKFLLYYYYLKINCDCYNNIMKGIFSESSPSFRFLFSSEDVIFYWISHGILFYFQDRIVTEFSIFSAYYHSSASLCCYEAFSLGAVFHILFITLFPILFSLTFICTKCLIKSRSYPIQLCLLFLCLQWQNTMLIHHFISRPLCV
jgi:hypothetical protein